MTTGKPPPPQGQGRFIKIADPSICPTRGDFFLKGAWLYVPAVRRFPKP